MAKSRRRLLFSPSVEETGSQQGTTCCLCLAPHIQLSAPESWKNAYAKQIALTDLHLTTQSLVCRLCRDDISKVVRNPAHTPRWVKVTNKTCCVPTCSRPAFVNSKIASSEQTQSILKCECVTVPYPTPLCKQHYHTVYDALQQKQTHCCTCNSSLRSGQTRSCPDATKIQQYLAENTGFEGNISEGARVCMPCYRSHLQILKETPVSTDRDLLTLITTLKHCVQPVGMVKTIDDVMNRALYSTAIYVAEKLLEQEALLLPSVHTIFCTHTSEVSTAANLELEKAGLVTAHWLLSNLVVILQHHMSYACRVRKLGTLSYRTNGDLLTSLSLALHVSTHTAAHSVNASDTCTVQVTQHSPNGHATVYDDLNSLIHKQIHTYLAADLSAPYPLDRVNIDRLISEMDPQLWTFINSITRSVSERKCYDAKTNDPKALAHHVKRVRCLFILCTVMFCADDRCSIPLHTLITDTVESCGGSTQLVRILNRLGACSSTDTLSRSIQYRVQERNKRGPEKECTPDAPTIISTDNIDFVHSYAQVYCGTQTSSWHGTTVQAVQPMLGTCSQQQSSSFPMQIEERQQLLQTHYSTRGECTTTSLTGEAQEQSRHHECTVTNPLSRLTGRKRASSMRSPCPSPFKSCRSPVPKVKRRARTGMEGNTMQYSPSPVQMHCRPLRHGLEKHPLDMHTFQLSTNEENVLSELREEFGTYILQKHIFTSSQSAESRTSDQPIILNIQDYMRVIQPVEAQKSNVVYLQVLDAKSESKDTLMQVLQDLHQQFIKGQTKKHLVLTADAKLYEVIQSLKHEYGDELKWLLPFPGDWHLLYNYQKALMKPYFDAGLKELAQVSGYPTAAIHTCSQFKRTHNFLVEVWQALYVSMVDKYFKSCAEASDTLLLLTDIVRDAALHASCRDSSDFCARLARLRSSVRQVSYHSQFSSFLNTMSASDPNWKFWIQFVFKDAMAYISLYLAIRSGNWKLRIASIKLMAPVFSAFDHLSYRKLIAQHIADMNALPQEVSSIFHEGGFVVSLSGRSWHSVAIDEAHEMKINKECKMSIVRPSKDYISRVASYIPYRAKCLENVREQLFPEEKTSTSTLPTSILSQEAPDRKAAANIEAQVNLIGASQCLQLACASQELVNPYTKTAATPQQQHDLLQFRDIGQEEFEKYVAYFILKQASFHPPQRKKRLLTFSKKKATNKLVTQLEKDRRILLKCLHKKMKWSKRTGRPIDKIAEQYVPIPLALADSNGIPLKGQKSNTTKVLHNRYKDAIPSAFFNRLPDGWVPECVLLEGMFILNTTPLGSQRTLADFAHFLIKRFITPHFLRGSQEVHMIFDNPGRLPQTPKYFERKRRESLATVTAGHVCDDFHASYPIPSKWRDIINCRTCKRKLVLFLSKYFLKTMPKYMEPGKVFYLAGCFEGSIEDTAWYITTEGTPQPNPTYTCNAEETDTRLWLHAKETESTRILLISPDTDIYHIGLPLHHGNKEIIIQINPYNSKDLIFLHLPGLIAAFYNDPDLAAVSNLPQTFQTLFVATGCDYISFFSGIGKATFLRYFFQHAGFITSGQESAVGTLADVALHNSVFERGYLAFLRLVGVVYMKKHGSGFSTLTPTAYFNQFYSHGQTPLKHHQSWLNDMRECIWDRIEFENEMIPNNDALQRHWRRVCWVLDMWHQADQNTMNLKPISEYGWKVTANSLDIDWDSDINMNAVRERVASLLKGCGCKTGCQTRPCGCLKKGKICGEGCVCTNCTNTHVSEVIESQDDLVSIEEIITDVPQTENVDELMEWVFGECDQDNCGDSDSED